jgi:uncharacterized protein
MTAPTHDDESIPRLPAPHPWFGVLVGFVAVLILTMSTAGLVYGFVQSRPMDLRNVSLATFETVEHFLLGHHIAPDSILQSEPEFRDSGRVTRYYTTYDVTLPPVLDAEGMKLLLDRRLRDEQVRVANWTPEDGSTGLSLSYGRHELARVRLRAAQPTAPAAAPPRPPLEPAPLEPVHIPMPKPLEPETAPEADTVELERLALRTTPVQRDYLASTLPATVAIAVNPLRPERRARLAIIVDDGGYGGAHTETILALDNRLTLSILPNTPHGKSLAKRAAAMGFEIMLHMPMENMSEQMRHDGEITTAMDAGRIANLTRDALRQVPGARGINNHTGSKFTRDAEALGHFLAAIQGEGLYFIDSRTTPLTRGLEVARGMRIPSAQRDLFLDHVNDMESIRARFHEVMLLAETQGQAIAICHFRPNTAAVLAEMLPELERRGIELVHASEFVR